MKNRLHWSTERVARLLTMMGGGVEKLVLFDQFTDADDTSLDAHIIAPLNIPAATWSEVSGDWRIASNKADPTGDSPGTLQWDAVVDVGVSNYKITGTINLGASGSGSECGFVVRYNTTDDTHYAVMFYSAAIRIRAWTGAAFSTLVTVPTTLLGNTNYYFEVSVKGASITALVNGVSASYTSATVNSGSTVVGIRANETSHSIDNLKIYT